MKIIIPFRSFDDVLKLVNCNSEEDGEDSDLSQFIAEKDGDRPEAISLE